MEQGGDDQGNGEVDDGLQEEAACRAEGLRCWKAVGEFCKSSPRQDIPKSQDPVVCHHPWVQNHKQTSSPKPSPSISPLRLMPSCQV